MCYLLVRSGFPSMRPLSLEYELGQDGYPGRKPVENRKTFTGILFVLKTGILWEDLPQEMAIPDLSGASSPIPPLPIPPP